MHDLRGSQDWKVYQSYHHCEHRVLKPKTCTHFVPGRSTNWGLSLVGPFASYVTRSNSDTVTFTAGDKVPVVGPQVVEQTTGV